MSRSTKVELTNMCLVYDENRVLVQEKVGKEYAGGLIFPGGHIEDGESILESVMREVREETGLMIHHPELCGVKDWFEEDGTRYLVMLYKCNNYEGEIRSSEEGRVFWLDRSEIPSANLIYNMRELMQIFEGDYSEFITREVNGEYVRELLR